MSSAHLTKARRWLLNSPPGEWMMQRLRELLIGALRQGPIPQHVAFVMDGNRRYARQRQMEPLEGHHLGFEALAKTLEVCYKSGVKVVTVYAFSVENFKRSKYEVDALMDMAKVKLSRMAQHGELLQRYGARIQISGQRSLLRKDVLEVADRAVEMTKNNGDAILNVCFPYTSRHEMTLAVRETVCEFSAPLKPTPRKTKPFSEARIARQIQSKRLSGTLEDLPLPPPPPLHSPSSSRRDSAAPEPDETDASACSGSQADEALEALASSRTSLLSSAAPSPHRPCKDAVQYRDPESITADSICQHMFTGGAPPLDLLIRTSGVQRLSDFMLWQCHETTDIVFLDCLWPEFDLWQFLPVLAEWQWKQRRAAELQPGGVPSGVKLA